MLKSGHVWKKDEQENKGGGLKIRKVHLFERKKILLKICNEEKQQGCEAYDQMKIGSFSTTLFKTKNCRINHVVNC